MSSEKSLKLLEGGAERKIASEESANSTSETCHKPQDGALKSMTVKSFTIALFVTASLILAIGIPASKLLVPQIRFIEKEVYVSPPKKTLDEIIAHAAEKAEVPEVLIRAIIDQESNWDASAVRFEQHYLARVPKRISNPDKRRLWASSIGLMQVMSTHLLDKAPGQDYTALYDPEFNVAMGTRVLKDCLMRHDSKALNQKYRLALVCYNGSEAYADEVLKRVAVVALANGGRA
jgi:soluble lytic murein transglycosylase-like protein